MAMTSTDACEVLRTQARLHHKKFFHMAGVALFFLSLFGLVGLLDGMPLWQAGLACAVLGLIALLLCLRGLGRLGTDVRVELERWIRDPSLVEAYDSKMVDDGHDQIGEAGASSGGPPSWRVRIYLASGRKISMSMGRKEKTRFIRSLREVFPEIKCRRIRKK
jgi:hypothetical protein